MEKFTTVLSDATDLLAEANRISARSAMVETLKGRYIGMQSSDCDKIVQSYITSNGLEISVDENGLLKSFDTDKVAGYVVSKDNRNVGTVRYFKEAGNVVFSANGSNRVMHLGRLTPDGIVKIVEA